jgi:hypothetical protein
MIVKCRKLGHASGAARVAIVILGPGRLGAWSAEVERLLFGGSPTFQKGASRSLMPPRPASMSFPYGSVRVLSLVLQPSFVAENHKAFGTVESLIDAPRSRHLQIRRACIQRRNARLSLDSA